MKPRAPVFLSPLLQEQFATGWEQGRVLFISAPCGMGKTTAAATLLEGKTVFSFSAGEPETFTWPRPTDYEVIVVDDLQLLRAPELQNTLCDWIRTGRNQHFVLLSRGVVPGWLMPFQFSGMLYPITSPALLLNRESTRLLLAQHGIELPPAQLAALWQESTGYPLALSIVCRQLAKSPGDGYTQEVADSTRRALFLYFEEAVYHRFETPMRRFLLNLTPFTQFDADMAKAVSGNTHVGDQLSQLLHETTMLQYDGLDSYHFWPIFREFLLWELPQQYGPAEQNAVYSRAGLYYEQHKDYPHALDCYIRAGEHQRVSLLLLENAKQHPGLAHYYEMERYYDAIPRAEVLRNPALLCGMSMLTALCLDFDASEEWYRALKAYAARLKPSDAEYKETQGRLAFLDISLPQRGSGHLVEQIGAVFRLLANQQISLPAFSVTSALPSVMNGGKDFCDWSRKDELLYKTFRLPVEAVLGRDSVCLADCALCESKFEKGEDISARMLALMARQNELQRDGTPDMEFAVVGLLVRYQISRGKPRQALETLESLRAAFLERGETRFLPNMDAMRCRIWLRTGDTDAVEAWLDQQTALSGPRLRALWRYRYATKAKVQIYLGACEEALLTIAPLLVYCDRCGRVMDGLYLRLLVALCHYRMQADTWQAELAAVLDTAHHYGFIRPISKLGVAVLPLLTETSWAADPPYLDRLTADARRQAVHYPRFLQPRAAALAEPLSGAELQVLKLITDGLSNPEIGDLLAIAPATVKTHINHIWRKLGVRRRSEACEAAHRLHLV